MALLPINPPRSAGAFALTRALVAVLQLAAPLACAQHYTFSIYGVSAGLTNVNVTALIQAPSGTVWVGTQEGIFSADGSRFQRQSVFDDAEMDGPWAMRADPAGRVWAVDGKHLAFWENGRVRVIPGFPLKILSVKGVDLITLPGQPEAIFLLHDGELQRIASADNGRSWQVSQAFTPGLLAQHRELRQLTAVASGGGSTVWAGCGKSVCSIDLSTMAIRVFGARDGLQPDTWLNLLLSRAGDLWARGGHMVQRLPAGSTRWTPASGRLKPASLDISPTSLVEDPVGRVLMNIAEGIVRTRGPGWQLFSQKNGLPQDEIDMMIFDRDGGLWLDLSGRGISHWLGYGNWEGWTKADGLSSNVVLGITQDHAGRKWVATGLGLDRVDPATGRVIAQPRGAPFHQLTAVAAHGAHVWTGDNLGNVYDFDPANGSARLALDHLDTVYQILADREDRIWVCSPKGLDSFIPADNWTRPHHVAEPSLPPGNVYEIAQGVRGVLWVTTEKGLSRFDGSAWTPVDIPLKHIAFYTLMIAAAPDGTLWVQRRRPAAILHLKVTAGTTVSIGEFSDSSMAWEGLGFMGFDQRGWLWIESDQGVQVYDGHQWVRCSADDGLLWNNLDYPAFFADPDGSVWLGTSSGVSHVLHPERIFRVQPPTVQLADVRLADRQVPSGTTSEFNLPRPLLTARIAGPNYNRDGAIVYRYRLEGQESEWQETEGDSLRFPALSPGLYTLTVIAYDRRTHQSSAPQSVSFNILEPWWNRPWFHLVELLAAAAIVLALWRLSIRLFVIRQRALTSLVASRTQELEREKAELVAARAALIETSQRDGLTGFLNRTAIFERLHTLSDQSVKNGTTLAVVMADLDHFKHINDDHGHVVGDTVIRECSARIRQAIRPGDLVGRYGGEEFLILMPGLDPSSAPARMEQLRLAIAGEPIRHQEISLHVTCSFGLAWMGTQRCPLEALVSMADAALYLAKQNGRNRVEFAAQHLQSVQ